MDRITASAGSTDGRHFVGRNGRHTNYYSVNPADLVILCCLLFFVCLLSGCGQKQESQQPEVIVYTALDREFSEPIFEEFTKKTGIAVRAKYDAESTKTVGLTEAILNERARPRCDLFWNNEVINTIRLERAGLLRPYNSPAAANYPKSARSPDGMWYGFAARARVLIVNKNQRHPKSIRDLTDAQWHDVCGMAKPLFGTTATHAACLFAAWGDKDAKEFFQNVKRNTRIMSGNRQVAEAVAANQLAFGVTDTDDALGEIAKGMPVEIVYPDQRADEIGTLFIPNTLSLMKDSPHPKEAEKLLDFLLSADVERQLAAGPSAQIPLQTGVEASPLVKTPAQVKAMEVDWAAAAGKWDAAAQFLKEQFTAGD